MSTAWKKEVRHHRGRAGGAGVAELRHKAGVGADPLLEQRRIQEGQKDARSRCWFPKSPKEDQTKALQGWFLGLFLIGFCSLGTIQDMAFRLFLDSLFCGLKPESLISGFPEERLGRRTMRSCASLSYTGGSQDAVISIARLGYRRLKLPDIRWPEAVRHSKPLLRFLSCCGGESGFGFGP